MSDRTRVKVGRSMAAVGTVGAVGGVLWLIVNDGAEWLLREWVLHNALAAIGFGAIAWVVLPTQPRNGAVWVSAWTALFGGLFVTSMGMLLQLFTDLGGSLEEIYEFAPADLAVGQATLVMAVSWLFLPTFLPLNLGLVLFPDGNPPSARWRWAVWASITSIVVSSLGLMWYFRPSSVNPYGAAQGTSDFLEEGGLLAAGLVLETATVLAGVVALAVRYRRSSGRVTQQIRWVMWGGSIAAICVFYSVAVGAVTGEDSRWPFMIALAALIGSYGIAIGRYRLYDIDVVVSRTLVYGTLALFIGAVYVGIAVVPWILLGSEANSNAWLGIVATVVVAVSFQPVRRRLERLANRLVFGRRATPYEVLSTFSQGVSAVDPDVLGQVARSLTEGTTADSVSIWIGTGEDGHCIAAWPEHTHGENVQSTPVVHDGEELGRVELDIPPGQPFPETDRRLLEQVAAGLGLAMRNLQLTDDLRHRVEELAASRRRIVTVQDETRRKLERDLHDGAQQRLVALKIKLGIGSAMAEKSGLEDVKMIIDTVREETDHTIDSVRDFARGIYPPLLEAEGLGRALTAQARRLPIPVTVQAAGLGRYPKEQEATVYFCVLEALQNAMKHSEASSVQVVLTDQAGQLEFEVRDDGVGFDKSTVAANGLINMVDRVAAIGGDLSVESEPRRGTRVVGQVPLKVEIAI